MREVINEVTFWFFSRAVGHRTQFNTVDYKTSGNDNYLKQRRNSLPSEGAQITTTLDDLLRDIITSVAMCFSSFIY